MHETLGSSSRPTQEKLSNYKILPTVKTSPASQISVSMRFKPSSPSKPEFVQSIGKVAPGASSSRACLPTRVVTAKPGPSVLRSFKERWFSLEKFIFWTGSVSQLAELLYNGHKAPSLVPSTRVIEHDTPIFPAHRRWSRRIWH